MQWLLWISLAWGAVSEAEWQELAGQTVRLESTSGKQLEGKIVSLRDETVRIERTRDGLLVEVRKDEVSSALNLSAPTPDPSPAQQPMAEALGVSGRACVPMDGTVNAILLQENSTAVDNVREHDGYARTTDAFGVSELIGTVAPSADEARHSLKPGEQPDFLRRAKHQLALHHLSQPGRPLVFCAGRPLARRTRLRREHAVVLLVALQRQRIQTRSLKPKLA